MNGSYPEVTELLGSWRQGAPEADQALLERVYGELSRIAARHLRHERVDHTLEPTALVHEAYVRLLRQRHVAFRNRSQFFALAARMMRRVLIDYERRRHSQKRGGGALRVTLHEDRHPSDGEGTRLTDLDAALTQLAEVDARKAEIIELRFFGGLTLRETAEALGCSPRTVAYEWQVARAWLARELQ